MFERNLKLTTQTFNGAHIERINFEFSQVSKSDTTGVIYVWTVSGKCWPFDPQTVDGKRVLAYAELEHAFAKAHYKRQLADFEFMCDSGQISEGEEFRRPVMPVENPEQLF